MILKELTPKQALNKAFLRLKPTRIEIDNFKKNLTILFETINDTESEEFHKNLLANFFKETYYKQNHFINAKGRNDLVIHNGQTANTTVGVIIETKKPDSKTEMLARDNINKKAFHELVLYYLRERIIHKNLEIKHLIVTNVYEWFVFDATLLDKLFAQDKNFVHQFIEFEEKRLVDTKTDFFYKQIAEPFIKNLSSEIEFTYFKLLNYKKYLQNLHKEDDYLLIPLFKILSPEHLLKLPFANDSNTLDRAFYNELLYIIGLTEVKDAGKKLIQRNQPDQRYAGTILEDAISQLDSLDKLSRLNNSDHFGNTKEERLFNAALELSITWINRILFLKLLEAQLLTYHNRDKSYSFLRIDKIKTYNELNSLFFQVLAKKYDERNENVRKAFEKVPYLNSSLFEPTPLEHATIFISNLNDSSTIPIFAQTVLKDRQGNKRTGHLKTLQYLFEFLDAYDFGAEGKQEIQEDNKTLINAAVLGLIFEKINGYRDGSFFTPGFITMYMCREIIRKAVLQKFNQVKGWKCADFEELYDKIDDRKEANQIVNSLKICDPAVGSGHFLVSALNEIIAIKSDLKILQDRNGRRLKEYHIEVQNDELTIIDEDGEVFEYNPNNKESQRVQETLFHEKQTIIENCLFGVDINPNSVKICRLRLWIELLKNAYYKTYKVSENLIGLNELETLPNIDINIKCGNSLISRFPIDANLANGFHKGAKNKWNIDTYKIAVATYRNTQNKEQKREMERLIADIKADFRTKIAKNDPKLVRKRKLEGELFSLMYQTTAFESQTEKQDKAQKAEEIQKEIDKLTAEIQEIENNKVFENAFEWRFEFPEILDDNGNFVGFDIVIGNPPYIRQEDIKDLKKYLQAHYQTYHSMADLYVYFIERCVQIVTKEGFVSQITNNKWLITGYGEPLRRFLLQKRLLEIVNFGDKQIFADATTYPNILTFKNQEISLYKENVVPRQIRELISLFKAMRDISGLPEDIKQSLVFDDSTDNSEVLVENIQVLLAYKKELNGLFGILEQALTEIQNFSTQLTEQIEFKLTLFREKPGKDISTYIKANSQFILQNNLSAQPWIISKNADNELLNKIIQRSVKLGEYVGGIARRGIITGLTEAFIVSEKKAVNLISANSNNKNYLHQFLLGRETKPYVSVVPSYYLIKFDKGFTNKNSEGNPETWFKNNFPELSKHLELYREKAEKRIDKGDYWWELRACDYYHEFKKPKIMYQVLQVKPCFIYDESGLYCNNSMWFIPTNDKVLLGILNSKMGWWLISKYCTAIQNGYQLIWKYFSQIPIATDKYAIRNRITNLVNDILSTKQQNPTADTAALENQIDRLVYELYDLTEEEIKIIEQS